VDCRTVQERLDAVLGIGGWTDDYVLLDDGSVMCKLQIRCGEEWIQRVDVGSPSEQPDAGDRLKSAFSDALKRAAVKFGVGRYLYRLPMQWQDYDPAKKQFMKPPQLPRWAQPAPVAEVAQPPSKLPATGLELYRRLQEFDQKLVESHQCDRGALLAHVQHHGAALGWPGEICEWSADVIPQAVQAAKRYASQLAAQTNAA
jgi:hypothetical protein